MLYILDIYEPTLLFFYNIPCHVFILTFYVLFHPCSIFWQFIKFFSFSEKENLTRIMTEKPLLRYDMFSLDGCWLRVYRLGGRCLQTFVFLKLKLSLHLIMCWDALWILSLFSDPELKLTFSVLLINSLNASAVICRFQSFLIYLADLLGVLSMFLIDDFRVACAVKGNVQVAGRTSSVSTTEMLSTHDVTLRNVDGSLFHVQIWFVVGHQDQNGQNWRNISQFTMWLSQSSVNVYQTYQSLYQFQHFAAKCDSAYG